MVFAKKNLIRFVKKTKPFAVFFLVAFFVTLSLFFFSHNIQAADDNANDSTCAAWIDFCDTQNSSTSCTNHGFHYVIYGYPGNAGNPYCCGDDSQEYYMARQCTGSSGDNSYYCDTDYSDTACCNNNYPSADCVFNHTCYDQNNAYDLNGDNRKEVYCKDLGVAGPTYTYGGTTYSSAGTWINCDMSSSMCNACDSGYKWTKAGESGVGEYSDTSTNECCGDDSGEYYITNYCPGYSGSGKCCNNYHDKIDANGNCVSSCPPTNHAPSTPSSPSPSNNATCVSTSPTISWSGGDPDGDTVTYHIYTCRGSSCTPEFFVSTTNTSYTLSSLYYNSIYRWQIIADDGSLQSTGSVWQFTTKPSTPSTPSNLHASSISTSQIKWSWNSVSGADHYTFNGSNIGNTTTYTYPSSGSANTSYAASVKACSSCGDCSSATSLSKYTAANKPSSCSGSAVSSSQINWSWNSGGAQKDFYASDSAGNSGWTTNTSWTQGGLSCGSYTLSVKARNNDNLETGSVSCTASVSLSVPFRSKSATFEAYNDVNFDNCPLSSPYPIKIFWSALDGESRDGFKIYRSTSTSKPSSPIATINPSADSSGYDIIEGHYSNYHYRDTSITSNNTAYHYWVTAYKGSCESSAYQLHMQSSSDANASLYSVFTTPTNFHTTSVSTNSISVAWNSHPLGSVGSFMLIVTPQGVSGCSQDPITTHNTSYTITKDCNGNSISENTTYNLGLLYARNYLINEESCGTTLAVTTPSSDTTGPSITFSPTSRSWGNTDVSVTVTASDSSGVASTKYCWTTGSSCTPNNSNSFSNGSSLIQSSNGSWNLCVTATDNHSNSTTNCSGRYQIDKTPPVVSNATTHCDSYTDTCKTDNDTTIYFTWSSSDSGGSGLSQCWAELNDSTPDEAAGTDGRDTDTGVVGSNTYYVRCKDNAGNYSNTDSDTITITTPSCNSNSDCNDGDSCTQDICHNPGQTNSYCTNDHYCSSNDTSCGCQTCQNCNDDDNWYDTGETRWVNDTSCTEKEQDKWEYRDYYCNDTSCTYTVTSTNWQDTGSTRNKADNTSCDGSCHVCCSGSCTDTSSDSNQKCCTDSDCDDNKPNTVDTCNNPGTCNSSCSHTQGNHPDLIVQDISWTPSIPSAGNTVNFTVKIKNQGNAGAGSSVVKYYVDNSYLAYDNVGSISAGGTATETFTWSAACGHSHNIKAVADANNNVSESNENNNSRTETITINNCLPNQPSVSGPTSGNKDQNLTFTAQTIDPDGDNIRYNFDWGDNTSYTSGYVSSGTAKSASHSWGTNGDYNVCVRAADSAGWSSPSCRVVSIGNTNPGNQAPTANFEFCKENGTQRTIRFTDESSDPDGSVVGWSWNFGDGNTCLPNCNESGFSGTNQNPVHTFPSQGGSWSYSTEAEAMQKNGCQWSKVVNDSNASGGKAYLLACGNDYIYKNVNFPTSGSYVFKVRARGNNAGGEWSKVTINIDGIDKSTKSVNSFSYKDFSSTITVSAGNHQVRLVFPNDYYNSQTGADRNLYIDKLDINSSGGGQLTTKYSYTFDSDTALYNDWQYIDLKSHPPVSIQAEFGEIHSPFRVSYDYNAEGRHYIWVPNGGGNGGYENFNFDVQSSGNYVIWAKTIAPNGNDDSFYVSIDGKSDIIWDVQHSTYWAWSRVRARNGADPYVFNLSKGNHTIKIKQREDGTKLDEIYITKEGTSHPNYLSPRWYISSGALEEKSDSSQSFLLSSYNSSATNYEISSDVRTIGWGDDGIAIIFGYQDKNNFYELYWDNPDGYYNQRWQPTTLYIYRYQNGTKSQLASKNVYSDKLIRNQWKNLAVRVSPSGIEGKINDSTKITYNADPILNKSGLGSWDNDGGVQFDNFIIKEAQSSNSFMVKLTATDNGGKTGSIQKTVDISLTSLCPSNYSPTVSNFSVSKGDYCSNPSHFLSWIYNDPDEDTESKFELQVDNNSNFSSPEINRTYSNLSYPSGTKNSQVALVSTSAQNDKLIYNQTYYWRVKVFDSKGADSGWQTGPSFSTDKHKYPSPDFSWQPTSPAVGATVQFNDNSQSFGGSTIKNWLWAFEGGNPAGSTVKNPQVIFNSQGNKKVDLTVVDSDGYSCQTEKQVPIGSSLPKWKEVAP